MIQIRAVVIYSHDGRHRVVPFEPGRVNIISGDSRTGKSAILGIIDYCFGAKEIDVPEGKVRRNVAWFALLLQTPRGQAFVARQLPTGDGKSNEAVYVQTDTEIDIPPASVLRQTTNREGLRSLLASWTGLSDYLHEPPAGQTRDALAATISHALTFCFQSQNEIAQRKHLFHGSSDRFVAQAIKDTLPYFLGAVTDDYIANQQELKRVRAEIRQIDRRLAEAAAIRGDGVGRADTLLAEAKSVGMSELPDSAPWQEKLDTLRQIQNRPVPSAAAEVDGDGEFRRLSTVRSELLQEQRTLQSTLERARSFEGSSKGYSAEAREHTARLQAVSVFEHGQPGHACPLCLQGLPEASQVPSIGDLRAAQDYINAAQLGQLMLSLAPAQSAACGAGQAKHHEHQLRKRLRQQFLQHLAADICGFIADRDARSGERGRQHLGIVLGLLPDQQHEVGGLEAVLAHLRRDVGCQRAGLCVRTGEVPDGTASI